MFDIWKNLKDLVSVNSRKVYISNGVFLLHYKVTVLILVVFSILVTSKQYLGDPIDCISSPDVKSIAEKYCWIHSTFTRGRKDEEGRWTYEAVEDAEIYPGIRPEVEGDSKTYHTYYQWVWCVLFLQSGLFYFPHWLWKVWEGGRLKLLVSDLNLVVIEDQEDVSKHKEAILNYFMPNKGYHTGYVIKYIVCELLNLLNVLAQLFVTDAFLNYQFSTYGLQIFQLPSTRPFLRHDALAKVFPTVTACRISTGGVAFNTVEYDLLCVLSINILNEKIYIFLWYWFLLIAAISILNLIYRILTIVIPPLRRMLMRRHMRNQRKSCSEYVNQLKEFSYGDWFLLDKIGQNINPIIYAELLKDLITQMNATPVSNSDSKLSEPLMIMNNKSSKV